MSDIEENSKITVNPKKDGAVITVESLEIEITVRPQWKTPRHHTSMGEPGQTIESLRMDLGPYLKDLEIIEAVDGIIVKPKRFLGRDFSPIAEIIEYYGGSYISGGRESRFTIPLKKTAEKGEPPAEEQ